MRIVTQITDLRRIIRKMKRAGKTIGLVPTMGALHEGHLWLIRRARRENDFIVVSIFVNPTQFNRSDDFRRYPRTLRADARLAQGAGADLVFAPSAVSMYPAGFQTHVEVEHLSRTLEGKLRPGHYRGVATVVAKLFHLVQPNTAYFGQKDAQQAALIRRLIQDLNFDVRLKILPTVREADGLAMSSRNRLLSSEARRSSRVLFLALQQGRRLIESGERRRALVERRIRSAVRKIRSAKIDYVAIVDPETFERTPEIRGKVLALLAVWIGPVRLIDEMSINVRGSPPEADPPLAGTRSARTNRSP